MKTKFTKLLLLTTALVIMMISTVAASEEKTEGLKSITAEAGLYLSNTVGYIQTHIKDDGTVDVYEYKMTYIREGVKEKSVKSKNPRFIHYGTNPGTYVVEAVGLDSEGNVITNVITSNEVVSNAPALTLAKVSDFTYQMPDRPGVIYRGVTISQPFVNVNRGYNNLVSITYNLLKDGKVIATEVQKKGAKSSPRFFLEEAGIYTYEAIALDRFGGETKSTSGEIEVEKTVTIKKEEPKKEEPKKEEPKAVKTVTAPVVEKAEEVVEKVVEPKVEEKVQPRETKLDINDEGTAISAEFTTEKEAVSYRFRLIRSGKKIKEVNTSDNTISFDYEGEGKYRVRAQAFDADGNKVGDIMSSPIVK